MENIHKSPKVYWDRKVSDTNLKQFQKIIETKYNIEFGICKTGPGFLDNEWFSGARLNYAENILRKRDNSIALICINELGNEEIVTYAQMYEEVQKHAAAFRKNGLKIGDRVACFMPNRKEAVFAMLAVASIGGMWGGPIPFFKTKGASDIINLMEAKFLFSIDSHQFNGVTYPTLDYLPEIMKSVPTLEKCILLVTKEETRTKDLSETHNCVVLDDFLLEGQKLDGSYPDLVFEQLPFNQPFNINFTSGTTGLPKGIVHSAGTFLPLMGDFAFTYNLKEGEIVCANYMVGWDMWDYFIPALGLGIPLFLYNGSPAYVTNKRNFWDLIGKHKVNTVLLVTSMVDKMEKLHIVPSQDTDLSSLKIVLVGATPVKTQNFEFLQANIKKDLLVGIFYGASEVFGNMSAIDMNLPVYGVEIQVPSLGLDIKCYDSEGNAVIGKRGELVVRKPTINFLTGLLKDDDKTKVTNTYFSKFPGVWTQHDECWINPKTNGMVIIGRSDDTIKTNAYRFGANDIYLAIHSIDELEDYICVSQRKLNGDSRAVLFLKMREGCNLIPDVTTKIQKRISDDLCEQCIPEIILEVPDIPYNTNNKRMESLVRKIIENNEVPDITTNIQNPECLKYYINIPELLS